MYRENTLVKEGTFTEELVYTLFCFVLFTELFNKVFEAVFIIFVVLLRGTIIFSPRENG